MARKIKFPLKMKDGYDARSIEELREHFNLESVLGYFADGRLHTWLKDRYLENEAQQVSELDPNDSELIAKICNILGVEAPNQAVDVDVNEINRYNEKRKMLLEKYPEPELMDNIDAVAFNEDDIISIIEKGIKEIYLIDNEFQFPFKTDMKNGQLLKKDGTSLPLDIGIHLNDCKFIGKNASLHIDDVRCVAICNIFRLQFENINFIFEDEDDELLFKGKVLKDVDALLSIAQSLYDRIDYKNAFNYYLMAAELGNPVAQGMLGQMYHEGRGVNRDSVQAAEWYKKAAEQGDADAQYELGVMYKDGKDIKKDIKMAINLLNKSSEQGNYRATFNLAKMYSNGEDIEIDIAESLKYFKILYNQSNEMFKGVAESFLNLYKDAETICGIGISYEQSVGGFEKDLRKAIACYKYAAEQGNEYAKERLRELGVY